MLSSEGPSGPSCSYQVSDAKSGERSLGSEGGFATGPAEDKPLQFSIRDYVSTVRRKDIRTNWPFHQKYVRLCLKHGISVLLPPFESPDSVRSHCYSRKEGTGQVFSNLESDRSIVEQCQPASKEAIFSFDPKVKFLDQLDKQITRGVECGERIVGKGKHKALCEEDIDAVKYGQDDIESVVITRAHAEPSNHNNHLHRLDNDRVARASVELEVGIPSSLPTKLGSSREPSRKKYRLIVKLGANPELGRAEKISSSSSLISDPMASKVCPVCKAFSSTSNTTLNAHIDQCLSMQSNTEQVIGDPFKCRVKPTKKRLVLDIYNTSSPCTLEDLDRRNGTTWALDLALVPCNREVCTESKRQKISSANQADGETENGAVYIDSSGTKICILSKLNSMAVPSLGESSNPNPESFDKDSLRPKLGKRHFVSKQLRHLKANTWRKKSGFLGFQRVKEVSDNKPVPDSIDHETQSQSESASPDQTRNKVPEDPRSLFSSRSSADSKKPNCLIVHKNCEKSSPTQSPLIKSSRYHLIKSSSTKCAMPKLKSIKMLSNALPAEHSTDKQSRCIVDDECSHSVDDLSSEGRLLSKPCESLRKLESFPKRNSMEQNFHLREIPGNFSTAPAVTRRYPLVEGDGKSKFIKLKKKLLHPSSVVDKRHSNRCKLISKRLRKHRSRIKTHKQVQEQSPDSTECFNTKKHSAISISEVNDAENFRKTKNNCIINHRADEESSLPMPVFKVQCASSEKDITCGSPEGFNLAGQSHSPEAFDAYVMVDSDTGARAPLDGTANPPITSEQLISEDLLATSDSGLRSWSRLVENDSFIPCKELWTDAHDLKLFNHQMLHSGNEISDSIVGSGDLKACVTGLGAVRNSFLQNQYAETNAQLVLGPSACQSCSANTDVEILRGSSSVTSVRISSVDEQNKTVDSEPCDSPLSGTSNISHPSGEEMKEQILGPLIGEKPIPCKDSRGLAIPDVWESGSAMKHGYAGECNIPGALRNMSGQQHGHYWGNHHCCCSQRLAVCQQTQSSQCMIPEMNLPLKARKIALKLHRPMEMAFPSFDCPRSAEMLTAQMSHSPCDGYQNVNSDTEEKCFPSSHDGSAVKIDHPTPNPVLRLMGKDVMIMNKDDHPQHQSIIPCYSGITGSSSGQYSSFHARPSTFLGTDSSSCDHHRLTEGWKYAQIAPKYPSTAQNCNTYSGVPIYSNFITENSVGSLQHRSGWDTQITCHMEKGPLRQRRKPTYPTYETREVIVIEDSAMEADVDAGEPSPASTLSSPASAQVSRQARTSSIFHSPYLSQASVFAGDARHLVAGNPSEFHHQRISIPNSSASLSSGHHHSSGPHSMPLYF